MRDRPAIPRVVVASKNRDKIVEIEAILLEEAIAGEIVRGLAWPDVDETESTLEGNALLKARAVAAATGLPAVADDTGLEIAALGGRPGVHTARYAGPEASYQDNVDKVLGELDQVVDRSAVFRTVVALVWPDGQEVTAEGWLDGRIANHPRGAFGFGYDPVFEVEGATLAELGPRQKASVSHRAAALGNLAELVRRRPAL